MPLNYVLLAGTINGGPGATVEFSPSNWLADPGDSQLIAPVQATLTCDLNGHFTTAGLPGGGLLATDNTITPGGWYWTVTISGIPNVGFQQWSFFLPYDGGAGTPIDLSELAQITAPSTVTAYLPMPVGTAAAGEVPVATGSGNTSEWGTANSSTVTPVDITTESETVIASVTIPAGRPAGTTYRLTVFGTFSVGATGGQWTVKARVGGLGGSYVGSITTTPWSASVSGWFVFDAIVQLQTPGTSGTWNGFVRDSSLGGTQTNTASYAGTVTKDSTVAEQFVITMALGSATMTAVALGSVAEPLVP